MFFCPLTIKNTLEKQASKKSSNMLIESIFDMQTRQMTRKITKLKETKLQKLFKIQKKKIHYHNKISNAKSPYWMILFKY